MLTLFGIIYIIPLPSIQEECAPRPTHRFKRPFPIGQKMLDAEHSHVFLSLNELKQWLESTVGDFTGCELADNFLCMF